MTTFPQRASAAVLLAACLSLTGCGEDRTPSGPADAPATGRHAPGDGAIDMDGDRVRIDAGGQPQRATVTPDGRLLIGDVPAETDAAGRSALVAYAAAAVALKAHAIGFGRTGAEFGVDVLREVVRGLFDGDMDRVGDHAREGARDLVGNVRAICDRLAAVHAAQTAAAAAVPAFAPYAVLDAEQVSDCHAEIDEEIRADERGDSGGGGER